MSRLQLLDYARFVAAVSVMASHYLFNGIRNGKISSLSPMPDLAGIAKYGYLGVELFFMISGYVIFCTSRDKTPGQFAVSRAVRLFPAFWVAMLFTACMAMRWGEPSMGVSLSQVLVNLTMVPGLFGVAPVDGVYWTLALEVAFYGLVLLLLLAGLRPHLETCFLFWPMAMLLAALAGQADLPFLGGYYACFAAGALFAILRERTSLAALAGLAACLYLCLTGTIERAHDMSATNGVPYSDSVIGIIVTMQFAFFALLTTPWGQAVRVRGSRVAGGITYPLYLLHAHVGYMLLSRFANDQNRCLAMLLVVAAMLAASYAIHRIAEQQLAGTWKRVFHATLGQPLDALASVCRTRRGHVPSEWPDLIRIAKKLGDRWRAIRYRPTNATE